VLGAGYDDVRVVFGDTNGNVLVRNAWVNCFELLQESGDGVAIGRRRGVEQKGHGCSVPHRLGRRVLDVCLLSISEDSVIASRMLHSLLV